MKKLDRYILGKFLGSFFFVVLLLTSVICVIDYTEKNGDFLRHNLSFGEVMGGYFVHFAPYIANMLSPITVFIATVFVTARLAARTEIIAILASGVSFVRLLVPYVIGAILIGLGIFYLNSLVIPKSNRERVAFEEKYTRQPFIFAGRNLHLKIAPETFVYLESYNAQAQTGYSFTLETIRDDQILSKLKADRIIWQPDQGNWRAEVVTVREIDTAGQLERYRMIDRLDTTLRLTPDDFDSDYLQYETLTTPELTEWIRELEERGSENIMPYRIERYLRVTYPFAILILTVIGVILSARKSREGAGFQIALGFVLAFVYILFFIMSRSIAMGGSMDPLLACWLPNLIFAAIGALLYKTVPR